MDRQKLYVKNENDGTSHIGSSNRPLTTFFIARCNVERKSFTNSNPRALNKQEGGNHYKGYAIQPVQYAHANHLDFLQGSVVKYVTRFRDKNGKEDLLKARHFIDMLIELEYGGGNETK